MPYLCSGKTRPKPSARSTDLLTTSGQMAHVHVLGEQVGCRDEVSAHAELAGDLVADGDVVTGDHLDGQPVLHGTPDGLLGVVAGRIEHRENAEENRVLPSSSERATPSARMPPAARFSSAAFAAVSVSGSQSATMTCGAPLV